MRGTTFAALLLAFCCGCASSSVAGGDGGGTGSDGGPRADADTTPDGPPPDEICDGIDNDGDQFVDEGGDALCGTIPNAMPVCNGLGGCRIGTCNSGFSDVNNLYGDGCECAWEATENSAESCDGAVDLGQVPDTATVLNVTGNLVPIDDVDWYRFTAVDTPDSSCDAFHVRVQVVADPNGEFQIEMWRGGCAGEQICPGSTDAQWYVNYQVPGSPPQGQCPCTGDGSTTVNTCVDDSAEFIVKVSRMPGKGLSCNSYNLEISNGVYPAP